jgi:putative transcriptional regulator
MAAHYQTGVNDSRQGSCLVAHPNVPGQLFAKSVIYLYQDDTTTGSAGIILNKQTNYSVAQLFHDKGFIIDDVGEVVYAGGPVNTRSISLLHTNDWRSKNTVTVGAGVCLSSDNFMFEKMAHGNIPKCYRFFVGQCGWSAGQLEAEVMGQMGYASDSSWLTTSYDRSIVFDYTGISQWEQAVNLCSTNLIDSLFKA